MGNRNVKSSCATGEAANIEPSGSLRAPAALLKPVVIGVYGVSGSGKTFLLDKLREDLGPEDFEFLEGSKVIDDLVPGGLDAFRDLEEAEKVQWRQRAIDNIQKDCADSGRTAVVAGHYMLWSESEETGKAVYTKNDLDVYTHILYLRVPPYVVSRQCENDTERSRPNGPKSHIRKWQDAEMTQLRDLCRSHDIFFSCLRPDSMMNYKCFSKKVATLLRDFRGHGENHNLSLASSKLDETIAAIPGQLDTMLVMDGDKTLAAEDTGALFWRNALASNPLKTLFGSSLGYSYTAFRQATLLYEEECDDERFDGLCDAIATEITIYPEVRALLLQLSNHTNVGAVVVTSGLRHVWAKLLERECLADRVKVIGGGRISDGFVFTPGVKGALVSRLQVVHGMYVWAFGDSPLDLEMLKMADRAIVVVGDEGTRSSSMDVALADAINSGGLRAHQALLPSDVSPRLDTARLPLVQLTDSDFIDSIFSCHHDNRRVFHASDRSAAKLLMTLMRDAAIAGPRLREEHHRVGSYLATEFLADIVGIENYPILHVQGHTTTGYRLLHEKQTLIVALMRGGEPMAFGVNEVFPQAKFLHAKMPDDIEEHRLKGILNIFLVDSVVNTGQSIVEFVEYVRRVNTAIRIVVVAGVVQTGSISKGRLSRLLVEDENISIVTLRLSENKFTGRGGTDTGHRLFNTTDLD